MLRKQRAHIKVRYFPIFNLNSTGPLSRRNRAELCGAGGPTPKHAAMSSAVMQGGGTVRFPEYIGQELLLRAWGLRGIRA